MAARILNGNEIRDQIYGELAGEISALAATAQFLNLPTLLNYIK